MITTIHQPEHLPWLGFFDKMQQADLFVLLDNTQFAKDDFQNRNRIKTANGPLWLTVPVYKKRRSIQRIIDVEICNERNWQARCWSQIEQNYKKSLHFVEHRSFFEKLYQTEWTKLVDLNIAIIRYLAQAFGIDTELVTASELGVETAGATEVNLEICQAVDASVYISGKMGQTYLDEPLFQASGIEVIYQDFQHPEYPQLWGDFTSHMSAIDLLFNCGEKSLDIVINANKVVEA